jgi:hypothetical protein
MATGIAVLSLMGASPALSQDGFQFASPAQVTIGRDYGFLAHGQKLTDTVLVVRPPAFKFTNTTPRAGFTGTYQPEIELFDNNRDLNALNHTGAASFTARISERLRINATNDLLVTQVLLVYRRKSDRSSPAQLQTEHGARRYQLRRPQNTASSFDNVAASALNTAAFRAQSARRYRFSGAVLGKNRWWRTYSLLNAHALPDCLTKVRGPRFDRSSCRGPHQRWWNELSDVRPD